MKAEEKRYYVHCPKCSADFSVVGKKPLMMRCPACGEKGVLR